MGPGFHQQRYVQFRSASPCLCRVTEVGGRLEVAIWADPVSRKLQRSKTIHNTVNH